jgi:hypothetical protein
MTNSEEHVVGGVGVEGRVKVDQVNGFVFDVLPEHVQVVAEEKQVVRHSRLAGLGNQESGLDLGILPEAAAATYMARADVATGCGFVYTRG